MNRREPRGTCKIARSRQWKIISPSRYSPARFSPPAMLQAIVSDLRDRRIRNWLVAALAAVYWPLSLAAGIPATEIVASAAAAALVFAGGFGFFAAGWVGGGDVKLAAVAALWLGAALAAAVPAADLRARRRADRGTADRGWLSRRLAASGTGAPAAAARRCRTGRRWPSRPWSSCPSRPGRHCSDRRLPAP